MKTLHAGTNYKFLLPFFRKAEQTGRTEFKAGLGYSRLLLLSQGRTFRDCGEVFRIGYANEPDKYYEIAVDHVRKVVTPLRYIDSNAVSLDNSKAPLRELTCFWFAWQMPCPKPEIMRVVDAMLWSWFDHLQHREFYNAKYA